MDMLQKPGLFQQDLLGTLRSRHSFRTFMQAIDRAGLTASLNGAGPYTVFAPTDEAFRQLPHGTLDRLLNPGNRGELAAMVNRHVVAGRQTAADVGTSSGHVSIGDAQITRPDIMARNGVIHGIDKVNLPEPRPR